jgi:hypothetical protein
VTVSIPVAASELAVLAAGLVALLGVDLMLLRPAFAPLDELADTMRRHDPLELGALLHISKKTVERHRANILEKLGMRDRVEFTRYAIRRGLIRP